MLSFLRYINLLFYLKIQKMKDRQEMLFLKMNKMNKIKDRQEMLTFLRYIKNKDKKICYF
jgi:hypothetical protein